jgi:formylglycine-generating enzyme
MLRRSAEGGRLTSYVLRRRMASACDRSLGSIAVEMIAIPGEAFLMGSNVNYPEEAPASVVRVDGFWIDATPVTNRQFAAFVASTGHVTLAETPPNPADYPGALPEMLRAGSLVFSQPAAPTPLSDWGAWWRFAFGADWRRPQGPGSDLVGLEEHPVVHIAHADAAAYAAWAGKSLPTEAEWELAARGGLEGAEYAWGDVFEPEGRPRANTWQGEFPHENLATDGFVGTSPVGAFPPNGYGLFDMIGNVWEWTDDWYAPRNTFANPHKACCVPENPRGGKAEGSYDPCDPATRIPRKVLKGGSHLCAPNYCRRYRPAARYAQPIDTSTSHVGFRCVRRQS